jgi:hypothetical protein
MKYIIIGDSWGVCKLFPDNAHPSRKCFKKLAQELS